MADLPDHKPYDPDAVAAKSFSTVRKGFEPDEVRAFLLAVASSMRDAKLRYEDMERRLVEVERRAADPKDLDEHAVTQLLGEETARVLETARQAASDIRARAEQAAVDQEAAIAERDRRTREAADEYAASVRGAADDADRRIRADAERYAEEVRGAADTETAAQRAAADEYDQRVRAAADAEVADLRESAIADSDRLRTEAESILTERTAEAEVAASAILGEADGYSTRVRTDADRYSEATRAAADSYRNDTHAAADSYKADAVAEGDRLRQEAIDAGRRVHEEAEAAASASAEASDAAAQAALDAAREQGRQMVEEARTYRERVIADLADRRRTIRGQLDSIAATRDALSVALSDVGVGLASSQRLLDDLDIDPSVLGDVAADRAVLEASDTPRRSSTGLGDDRGDAGGGAPGPDDPPATDGGAGGVVAPGSAEEPVVDEAETTEVDALGDEEVDADGPDRGDTVEDAATLDDGGADGGADIGAADDDAELAAPAPATGASGGDVAGGSADPVGEVAPETEPGDGSTAEADDSHGDGSAGDESPGDAPELVIDPTSSTSTSAGNDDDGESAGEDGSGGSDGQTDGPVDPREGRIDQIFAKIRADRKDEPAEPTDDPYGASGASGDAASSGEWSADGGETEGNEGDGPSTEDSDPDVDLLDRRDAALVEIEKHLARRLKRVLADEQNETLDLLRRTKGTPNAEGVLPAEADHHERYRAAALEDLSAAERAGAGFFGAAPERQADVFDVAGDFAGEILRQIRAQLVRALDDGGDEYELGDRVRSCYREWKTQRIADAAAQDVLVAFNRGVAEAAADGLSFRWLMDDGDQPCPDCDDNQLGGAVRKGEPFPTGDLCPPAHPGCRCMAVPVP